MRRWWRRRSASAGDSKWSASAERDWSQSTAKGEGASRARRRTVGRESSQARAVLASRTFSSTSRRVSRSKGWSGQARETRG